MRRSLLLLALCAGVSACASSKDSLEASAIAEAEQMQELIRKHITDEDRAERLNAVQAKVHDTIVAYFRGVRLARDEWLRLNTSYDTPPSAFSGVQGLFASNRRRLSENLVRFAMDARKIATAEEWAAMNEDRRAR